MIDKKTRIELARYLEAIIKSFERRSNENLQDTFKKLEESNYPMHPKVSETLIEFRERFGEDGWEVINKSTHIALIILKSDFIHLLRLIQSDINQNRCEEVLDQALEEKTLTVRDLEALKEFVESAEK